MSKRKGMIVLGRSATLALAASLLGACVVQPYYPQQPPEYAPAPQDQYSGDGGGDYAEPQVILRATIAPPPLPVYEQPPCPADGYLWTPGYWAYGSEGYFWVPGTWVQPPRVGVLWTPGYWGWNGGVFLFHAGYWGPHIGFYGGINYGGGYIGDGFVGGRWEGDRFAYNRAVMNVNVNVVHNTYNRTVINNNVTINNVTINRVSYNGGPGGRRVAPNRTQLIAARDPHIAYTRMQMAQVRAASVDRAQLLRNNGGHPPVAATPRPRAFNSPQVERARGAVVPQRQFAPPGRQAPQSQYAVPQRQAPQREFAPPGRQAPQSQYAAPQRQVPQRQYAAPQRQAPQRQFAPPPRGRPQMARPAPRPAPRKGREPPKRENRNGGGAG